MCIKNMVDQGQAFFANLFPISGDLYDQFAIEMIVVFEELLEEGGHEGWGVIGCLLLVISD